MQTNQEEIFHILDLNQDKCNFFFTELNITQENSFRILDILISQKSDWINCQKVSNMIRNSHNMLRSSKSKKRMQSQLFKIFLIYQKGADTKDITGLLVINQIRRFPGQMHIEWLSGTWMFDFQRIKEFLALIFRPDFLSLIDEIFLESKVNNSYIFWDFPEHPTLVQMHQSQKLNPQIFSPYMIVQYPYDIKIQRSDNERTIRNYYIDKYGYICYNSKFDDSLIPEDLEILWKKAEKLYFQLKNQKTPKIGNEIPHWEKMLQRKIECNKNLKEIQDKLSLIKNCFANHLKNQNFFQIIIEEMKNIQLTFKIIHLPATNPIDKKLLTQFQNDLMIAIIESIPTHGSLFDQVADLTSELNPNFFDITFLEQLLGNYAVLMIIELESGMKVCLGYSCAFLNEDLENHSRKISNGIIIGEDFRRYSLGKVFAYVAARVGSNYGDIFYEDAVISNSGTLNMIAPLDFKEFGTLKNFKYSYDFNQKKFVPTALNRKYWFTPEFSRKISRQNKRIQKREKLKGVKEKKMDILQ